MSRIIQPVVSPRGRVIVLTGATLWLIAMMVLSATPDGAGAATATPEVRTVGAARVVDGFDGADGLLYRPYVVADRRGGFFVADFGNHRVIRVDDDLNAQTVFGREGAGPGEMQGPYGMAVDSHGNVFIADLQLGRINKFAPDATFIKSVSAPQAATLLIDSHDQLIVYPAPGPALMRRYSNDLEPGEELLQETDDMMHRSRMGVLMAMDSHDRLFVLDQTDLTVTVYGRDMQPLLRWPVTGPDLEESIARRLASARERNNGRVRVPGFQGMALDPTGNYMAFAYLVREEPDITYTRVVWYSTTGEYLTLEEREHSVYANALLADGRLIEGTAEALHIFNRGPQLAGTARGDN